MKIETEMTTTVVAMKENCYDFCSFKHISDQRVKGAEKEERNPKFDKTREGRIDFLFHFFLKSRCSRKETLILTEK